mgnify:CR=1 FL=1
MANEQMGTIVQVIGATFDADRMKAGLRAGFVMATDLADALVEAGVPFREAHHLIGALVHRCAAEKRELEDLTADEWIEALPQLTPEAIAQALNPVVSLSRRDQTGGPAPTRVKAAQAAHGERLAALRARIDGSRASGELMQWMRGQ